MPSSKEPELVRHILKPLLEDILCWFEQSLTLLRSGTVDSLTVGEQTQLLKTIEIAAQEVQSAKALLTATGVGVDPQTLARWHRLVINGWQLSQHHRSAHE